MSRHGAPRELGGNGQQNLVISSSSPGVTVANCSSVMSKSMGLIWPPVVNSNVSKWLRSSECAVLRNVDLILIGMTKFHIFRSSLLLLEY